MSLLLNYIQIHPKETKRFIGITLEQFNQLVNLAEFAEKQLNIEIEKHKKRVNVKGAVSHQKLFQTKYNFRLASPRKRHFSH